MYCTVPPERLSAYCRNIVLLRTCNTCLRSNPIAPAPSLESHFVFLLSSFLFSRPSAHFRLHDLSRIPTNFWRGSLIPLATYFFRTDLLSSHDPLFSPFYSIYHYLCAQLRTKYYKFARPSRSAITTPHIGATKP